MYTHRTYGRIFQNLQISILNITQTWEYREQLQLAAHCAHTSQSGSRHHQQTALTKNIKEQGTYGRTLQSRKKASLIVESNPAK